MTAQKKSPRYLFSLSSCQALFLFSIFYFLLSCTTPKPTAPSPHIAPPPPDPILLATDPCALRMQDIAAAMTVYLDKVHELPPSLLPLKNAAARVGLTLDFTCPVSHQLYIYVPNGLALPNDPHLLVLYDAAPSHEGYRWGILLTPAQGIQPLTTDVVRLTDPMLRAYLQQNPER